MRLESSATGFVSLEINIHENLEATSADKSAIAKFNNRF